MRAISFLAFTSWRASPGIGSLSPAWGLVRSPLISGSNNTSLAAASHEESAETLIGSGLLIRNTVHTQRCGRGAGSTLRSKPSSHPVSGWISVTTWSKAGPWASLHTIPAITSFPPAWWHCTLRRENMSFYKPFTLRTTSPTPPSSVHPFHLFIQNTKMTVFIYNVYLFHSVLSLLCIFVHSVPSRLLSLLLPLLLVVCPLLFTKSTLRHWKNSSTCSYCPGYCSPYFECIWIPRSQRLIEGKQKKWKQTSAPPGLCPPAPYIMLLIFPSHKSFNGRKKRR